MTRTRRSLLAGIATGAVVSATGCLGGDSTASAAFDCEAVSAPEPDTAYRPALGDPDAPIRIQVFEDFTCSHCATFATEELPTLRAGPLDAADVRYEHWDFPIPVDEEWAVPVASAARGVGARQGNEAFFDFAETVYESIGAYSGEAVGAAAEDVGADPCVTLADLQSETYADVVAADRATGVERGVSGTPTVIINGESVLPTADAITTAIETRR